MHRSSRARAALLLTLAGLVACVGRSAPSQFYLLQPLDAAADARAALQGLRLGVGPVHFPAYLKRPQMVIGETGGRFRLEERQRWAERLDDSFVRVLADNLGRLLGTDRVVVHPWSRSQVPDWSVRVDVVQLHAGERGQLQFEARWSVLQGEKERVARRSAYRLPVPPNDYAAIAHAHSEAVSRFSREVAATLRDLIR